MILNESGWTGRSQTKIYLSKRIPRSAAVHVSEQPRTGAGGTSSVMTVALLDSGHAELAQISSSNLQG